MTDENQEVIEHEDDSFDAFADAIDNGTPISDVGKPIEEESLEEPVEEVAELDEQPRDEQGRFTKAGEGGEEEPEPLPEAAEAAPETDWQKEAQQWEHRYKSDLGRQSALQRKIAEQEAMITQLKSQPQPAPEGMSDAEWDSLKNDFPEVAAGIDAKLKAVSAQYESQISQLQSQIQPIQQHAEDQYKQAQIQLLTQAHPDWMEVRQSDDFRSWVGTQPYQVQELLKSKSAGDAGWMLDQYKLAKGLNEKQQQQDELKAKRQQQLQSAQTVSRRGVVNQDFESDDALFDHYAELADKAKRRA